MVNVKFFVFNNTSTIGTMPIEFVKYNLSTVVYLFIHSSIKLISCIGPTLEASKIVLISMTNQSLKVNSHITEYNCNPLFVYSVGNVFQT